MDPIIDLQDLSVQLGQRNVLNAMHARFEGRALGLLGPNGAGKSTLINTLLGFHAPSSGRARVLGVEPHCSSDAVRDQLGYMPESDAFIGAMTGVHFVRYMAELSGLPSDAALERAHETFLYVGLGDARYRRLDSYSIGMKQLVKLAQALVHGPKLVFLDEPTNGLDPAARERMIRLIQEVRDSGQTRLVISSHLLHDVEQCCDEVWILRHGKLAAHVDLESQRRNNRKFLDLETSNPSHSHCEALRQAVVALGCDCAVFPQADDSCRVRVVVPDTIAVSSLYAIAQRHGILIRRMNYRRDSLEEIYLDVMREEHDHGRLDALAVSSSHGEQRQHGRP
jgi:ABC-2 type transport system ATP-binding protein